MGYRPDVLSTYSRGGRPAQGNGLCNGCRTVGERWPLYGLGRLGGLRRRAVLDDVRADC